MAVISVMLYVFLKTMSACFTRVMLTIYIHLVSIRYAKNILDFATIFIGQYTVKAIIYYSYHFSTTPIVIFRGLASKILLLIC